VRDKLQIADGDIVEVEPAKFPESLYHIRNKLRGKRLVYEEIFEIIQDAVRGNLSEVELSAFVTALHTQGIDLEEAYNLIVAMVNTGEQLKLEKETIVDKHSIGGIPGDKTTLILVPIIAAAGLTIPKTSSRAITSAAGTADKAEVLMPVDLDIEEMRRVVNETGGCIAWGGALHLAPADDIFVKIEYPLSIDPLMLPSILSKKKAVGANYLVIDIPTGRGSKVKTIGDAELLAKDFIELGKRLKMKIECAITFAEQPLGNTIGPSLEAKEALEILMGEKYVPDVVDKVTHLAGMLLEMVGKNNGRNLALQLLKTGKALEKMREIIYQQGGNSEIKPSDIATGDYGIEIKSEKSGLVQWINNNVLVEIARAAGSPKDKEAGIVLHKKIGERVKAGEILFEIFANKQNKLSRAAKISEESKAYGVGERQEMLIHKVVEPPFHKKTFILER
jgi:AMP phosphorylase